MEMRRALGLMLLLLGFVNGNEEDACTKLACPPDRSTCEMLNGQPKCKCLPGFRLTNFRLASLFFISGNTSSLARDKSIHSSVIFLTSMLGEIQAFFL